MSWEELLHAEDLQGTIHTYNPIGLLDLLNTNPYEFDLTDADLLLPDSPAPYDVDSQPICTAETKRWWN